MNRSEHINELAGALAKVQATAPTVVKDKTAKVQMKNGGEYRYNYADLGSVWEAIRAPLAENGLSVAQFPETTDTGNVVVETILMHTSGQWLSSALVTRPRDDTPQSIGSAITYLRRYALSAMVGVVADEDDDGAAASKPAERSEPARHEPPRTNGATNGAGAGITEKQLGMLRGKAKTREWSESDVVNFAADHGIRVARVAELTSRQASTLIEALVAAEKARTAGEASDPNRAEFDAIEGK